VLTGDVLLHLPVSRAALAGGDGVAGFGRMLADLRDVLSTADLALCHLEVPLSRDGSGLSGYPVFTGPPEVAAALAATGYDGCSVASNHAMDRGTAGIAATLDVLDAAGLGHAGIARSAAEDEAPRLYDVQGITVGHVSATYGLNGFVLPADAPWSVDLVDPLNGVLAEASAARAAGADVVVVSMHWGDEYRTEPSPYQRERAAALLDSPDVDLVVGHHAHVIQPVTMVGDKVVVFGLGNSLSGQLGRHTAGTQDGVAVVVTVQVGQAGEVSVVDMRAVPTWVEPGTYRVIDVTRELADPGLPAGRRAALEASLARTLAALGPAVDLVDDGGDRRGPVP
jgi:poly-gamma-glutamate synthesis protein (capsule biosynthesis protein)